MTDIVFTLRDVVFFLLFCFGVAACVYLIIIFKNLNKFFVNMNSIADENKESIETTIAQLPDMTQNITRIASGINGSVHKVSSVVGSVDGAITDTMAASRGGLEKILNFITMATATFNTISGMVASKKKKKSRLIVRHG